MELTKQIKYGYCIFDVIGEVTFEDSIYLSDYIINNITDDYQEVIINLVGVQHVPSSVLGTLLRIMKELTKMKKIMYLMNVSDKIMSALKVTEMISLFKIIENEKSLAEIQSKEELEAFLDDESF